MTTGYSLGYLLDNPDTVEAEVGGLFPTLSGQSTARLIRDIRVTNHIDAVREAVENDPEIGDFVVAENREALTREILALYRIVVREMVEEAWTREDGAPAFQTVYTNVFAHFQHVAQNHLEKEFVAGLMEPVREAHRKWIEEHPSFAPDCHLHIRPCQQDHRPGLNLRGVHVIDLGELTRRR
ncbi:MAG: hypothetical protein Q8P13_02390 [bacterium]|nr:hypothetical protein [bacterium]